MEVNRGSFCPDDTTKICWRMGDGDDLIWFWNPWAGDHSTKTTQLWGFCIQRYEQGRTLKADAPGKGLLSWRGSTLLGDAWKGLLKVFYQTKAKWHKLTVMMYPFTYATPPVRCCPHTTLNSGNQTQVYPQNYQKKKRILPEYSQRSSKKSRKARVYI